MTQTPHDNSQTLSDQNPLYIQRSVAMGKNLVKHLPRMNTIQMKLLFIIIEHVNWRENVENNIIVIDNHLAELRLDWHYRSDAITASRLRNGLKSMMEFRIKKDDNMESAPLILGVYGNKNYTAVAITPMFLREISNLPYYKNYFQFDIEDIMELCSKHSIYLYIELRRRQHYKRQIPCPTHVKFGTKSLKEIMGLDRESYTHKRDSADHFDRTKFEKEVLEKSLEEISHSRMIELFSPPHPTEKKEKAEQQIKKWYWKTKYNNHVKYYHICFRIREELFNEPWENYVNTARFSEIAQGFAPELEKPKYRAWLDEIRQTSVDYVQEQQPHHRPGPDSNQ